MKQTARKFATVAVTQVAVELLKELHKVTFIPKSKLVELALEEYRKKMEENRGVKWQK